MKTNKEIINTLENARFFNRAENFPTFNQKLTEMEDYNTEYKPGISSYEYAKSINSVERLEKRIVYWEKFQQIFAQKKGEEKITESLKILVLNLYHHRSRLIMEENNITESEFTTAFTELLDKSVAEKNK